MHSAMGTLHVCFAELPQYKSVAARIQATPQLNTTNETGAMCALGAAIDAADDVNKGTPLCSLSPGADSVHSISLTPRYERNISFFHQLSRRFGLLRTSDDPVFSGAEDDSTDSCSSTTTAFPPMQRSATGATATSSLCAPNGGGNNLSSRSSSCSNRNTHLHTATACLKDGHDSSSEHISCASSETSSTGDIEDAQEQSVHSPTATTKSTTAKERRSSARASFSRLQRRSTSSIRRAFESFSLSTRSLSCGGAGAPTAAPNTTQPTKRTGSSNTPIKSALKYNSNAELNRKSQTGCGDGVGWNTSHSASSLQLSSACGTTTSSATSKSAKGKTKPPPQRILRQPVSYTYLKGISGLPTQRVPRSAVCCQYARR